MLIFPIALMSGCGPSTIDPALVPYFDSFEREAAKRGVEINESVRSASLVDDMEGKPDDVFGICATDYLGKRVEIRRKSWNIATEWDKRSVVFHELGHCLLGREHMDQTTRLWVAPMNSDRAGVAFSYELPDSIMHPAFAISGEDLELLWVAYLDELFVRKPVPFNRILGTNQ